MTWVTHGAIFLAGAMAGGVLGTIAAAMAGQAARADAHARIARYDGDPIERVRARLQHALDDLGYGDDYDRLEDDARALALIAIDEHQRHGDTEPPPVHRLDRGDNLRRIGPVDDECRQQDRDGELQQPHRSVSARRRA